MATKGRHHVNARRGAYGKAISEKRTKEMEKANKRAPVVTYNIYITADTVNLEVPQENPGGRWEVYQPRRGRKPRLEYVDDPRDHSKRKK